MTGGGTDGSSTRYKMTSSGLVDGIVPVIALPDDMRTTVADRNAWVNRAPSTADCPSGQNTTTWAAGTHFTSGNINIDQNCVVTVAGDVWISGNLLLSNQGSLKTAEDVSYAPNILVDGSSGFQPSNNTSFQKNSAGTALEVKTFWSTAGSCVSSGTTPSTCPVPTGADLLTSSNTTTIQFSNAFTAPGASFYAVWSRVRVSNGTDVGQLIGQKVDLANSGTITFSGGSGGSGSTGNWDVTYYEQVYK